ncbi:MAG: PAS domain S-box protein [Candidatus Binataceae bacterium]|nr:PAS domain S-box protein [Candidatus Binataceae bacterium]
MNKNQHDRRNGEGASEDRIRLAEAASGIGTFELNLSTNHWEWTPQAAALFGFDPRNLKPSLGEWESVVFVDDLPKLRSAIEASTRTGSFHVEFRVRHADGSIHWIAGKGEVIGDHAGRWLRGAYYEITERKVLESRLLALNETLESRVAEVREEARTLEVLNRIGVAVAAELDLEHLVQIVTDAAVELSGAQFGAFFYNAMSEAGETYTLYTLSGASREAFSSFPMPRNTAIFEPTFRGHGPVRSSDIQLDPWYGKNSPYNGMPKGHLPVRSYMAVPVISRSGEVLGGLFFGHPQPGVFTERAERIVVSIAAQAAVAIDNARLYQSSQREIEARKRAEQELQRLNETLQERITERAQQLAASATKLEETQRRFQILVEGVTDYAIYMLDPQGYVINWNPGAERIKGYTREEILGQHYSRFYTEEDRAKRLPDKVIATATRIGKYEAEGWRVRKDGSRFWANVVVNAIHDPAGQLLGFAKITRDLTERRAAEEGIRQAQKMEAVGQLVGGVAHDFNNLLTVICGNIEVLRRRLPEGSDDNLRRLAAAALRGGERAAILTHRLLAFARRQPLQPKPLSVNTAISSMSEMLHHTLGENILVETVLAAGVWPVFVDANELESSLLNLAVNARDAMPDGGRLTIEAANVYLDEEYGARAEVPAGQYVVLSVSDTGTGMTPEVVSQAFEPFFTTKEVGQGTGLGLSQVYGFIKQSGGYVKIYSEVGVGTTIKLHLPRYRSPDFADETATAAASVLRANGETILVVEDDSDVRSFSVETLRQLGYQIFEAPDGAAALRLLEAHHEITLLFTDVGLPGGMNGRQLADEARRRRVGLKVLFTSGYARNAIIHNGRLDPGVELIVKPFTYTVLAAKIRHVLDET